MKDKNETKAHTWTDGCELEVPLGERSGRVKKTESRQGLYAQASRYARESIDVLVRLMRESKHESIQLNAARALLAKALPDLKSIEVTSYENGQFLIRLDVPKQHANTIIQPVGELQSSSD